MVFNRCGIRDAKISANDDITKNHNVKKKKLAISVSQPAHSSNNKQHYSTTKRSSLLLFFTLITSTITSVYAGEFCVANPQFNGVVDGSVAYVSPPLNTITQITIDGDCTFKNFTAADPLDVTINYQTKDDSIYLISFDNVVFSGNMACSNIDHKLWVVNSPDDAFSTKCQDIIIPAETIAKDIPAPTAGIGDPFTYTLTLPSMEFPVGDPSPNDLGNIVLADDLNALGVDVTLVGTPTVEWLAGGAVAHTFTNVGGLLTFDLPNITSGDQIVIKITLVLDDTAGNIVGTQFINTAKWTFSRWIDLDENGIVEDGTVDADGDGIIEDEFFDPLPGENGISLAMTIAEPDLVVSKTSTETALNFGVSATFSLDVQNTGGTNAWDAMILDKIPLGMCDYDPTTGTVTAQIFAADGTTPVSGVLINGTDYSVSYAGCDLTFSMLTAAAKIGSTERLIITYQSELDGIGTANEPSDGDLLVNIAGATEWFSGDGTYPRKTHSKTVTDGTSATVDHEDSYTITAALSGYYFQKTVQNITTGINPAVSAAPSDTLQYRLRVFNVDQNINTITIRDILDPTKFDTSTFAIVPPIPADSATSFDAGTGELRVVGSPAATDLNVAQGSEIIVDFKINLAAGLTNGDVIPNQATLTADGPLVITSDNPFKNGIAAPGDPTDTTDIVIQAPGPLAKVKPAQTTASIGEQFTYTITVPAVAVDVPLYDVRIIDDLTASNADLSFVSANVVSGGSWTLSNTGTSTNTVIEDTATGIDIPANGQAVIEVTVALQNTLTNQAGLTFNNTASYTYNRSNGNIGTQTAGSAGSSASMTVIEPDITTITKIADKATPTAGEIVRYSVTLDTSTGADFSDVFDVTITDSLSAGLVYEGNPTVTVGAGVSADNTISAPDITGDGTVATPQTLVWSLAAANADIDIVEGASITISYDVRLLNSVLANQTLTNSVVAQWTGIDGVSPGERNGIDGIGGLNDYTTIAAVVSVTSPDLNTNIVKTRIDDTYVTGDSNVRIGDIAEYELRITIPEGTLGNLIVVDTLPQGLQFEGIVSINGDTGPAPYTAVAPFIHGDIIATDIVTAGDPTAGSSSVTLNIGSVTNPPIDTLSNDFVVIYRARVLNNVFAHTDYSFTLTNVIGMSYDTADTSIAQGDGDTIINVLQPQLTVNKTASAAGGDIIIVPDEVVTYTVEIVNGGAVPIYDAVLRDIIPTGMRNGTATVTMVRTELEQGGTGTITALADPALTYDAGTGIVIWDLDSGVADTYSIPAGDTLRIVYQAQADAAVATGLTLTNSAQVTSYYSFDDEAVPTLGAVTGTREIYGPSNIATTTLYTGAPPSKALISAAEATIGDEVVYQITVPGTVSNSTLFDVDITDTLDTNMEFISATVTGGGIGVTDNSTTSPSVMSLTVDQIPAGQQVLVELRARILNVATVQQGVAVDNTVSYAYAYTSGGTTQAALISSDIVTVNIIEPQIAINKTVANLTNAGNPPTAGDELRYTLTFTASGAGAGDNFSDAFDISITDSLSLGLVYKNSVTTVDGAGNTITDPAIVGDGSTIAQTLTWQLADSTADIDVVEGSTVTVTYDVIVLNSVLANQALTNSAVVQWTGLDGISALERTGTATPALNDYVTGPATATVTTPDNTALTKSRVTDTYGAGDNAVRVGDIVEYQLSVTLQEGLTNNLVLTDTLPQGLAFQNITRINGDTSSPYSAVAPFAHSDVTIVTAGNPTTGPSTVTFTLGDVTNVADNNAANDDFIIVYRARVLDNVLAQANNITLTNTASLDYSTAAGAANITSSTNLDLVQPTLSITKTAVTTGGDTIVDSDEVVTYTVEITNTGTAPAYDVVVDDVIPVGMRNGTATITMVSTTRLPATNLTNIIPVYDAASGLAEWNFDTGVANAYNIGAGETLQIVYTVQTDSDLGAGLTLINQATARLYYSFDDDAIPDIGGTIGVREIYGPSNTDTVTLTSATAGALLKANPVDLTVAVGETYTYRITVPETPIEAALHDVRILDDLNASAADLTFVSVSKVSVAGTWTPENTGTNKNLIIEDTTNGIDIPAGEQVVIDITVEVDDTAINVSGLLFNNTATYTYNQIQNDIASQQNGAASTTADMTIVGPDSLTLEKTGPAQMRIGVPEIFTLDVHNTGTAPAWDMTIIDILPNPAPGGMCDAAPSNITAKTTLADGTTLVNNLVATTDYDVNYDGGTCTLTLTMKSAIAAVAADNRLIVTYETELDADNITGVSLTNIAAATEWFSADTAGAGATGAIRTYTRTLTDGTTVTLDHEDAHTVVTELPIVSVQKSVVNVTTTQNPGSDASPGDTLLYSINITNVSLVELTNFSFVDELDALNAIPAFAAATLNLVTAPATADITNTDANGGANGTGLIDIRNLTLGAAGSATQTVVIEFEVNLAASINDGTIVLNQGQMTASNIVLSTDDPNINGADDPAVLGDEDPTETLITSAPLFEVLKTSQDMTGDPAELLTGDTLRYTITMKNIGTENAINTILRDSLPANTTYTAGSTTLNGATVADVTPGILPLINGISVNAPEDTTPGAMRADATATTTNVATVTFDVVINNTVVNGTIISNQAFLNADGSASGLMPEQPSDDPATVTPDDPTLNVIGNEPLLDAVKTVIIVEDFGTIGSLDPNDVIQYTITINNIGPKDATGVTFTDAVPANTTYEADTVFLNGLPVAQPDLGVSPLIAGIDVSSQDITAATGLPTAGNGTISAGQSAVITFNVKVDAATAVGTVISNQGTVDSVELPIELTDADGIDSNGDQPTLIVVGNAQLVTIIKSVSVVGGGAALAGGELEYRVLVSNISSVPATNITITDNLDLPVAGQLSYIAGSGLLNGLATGVSYTNPIITADYATSYGDLLPGQTAELVFRATINNALAIGTTITNTGTVLWNAATQTATSTISIDVGGTPGVANVNGKAWHDANFNNTFDGGEVELSGWNVDIYRNTTLLGTVTTDATGNYSINGLAPNNIGPDRYDIRFRAPGSNATTAKLGLANSVPALGYTDALHRIYNIVLNSGENVLDLNLPIDPNGVVYNSVIRTAIPGATISLLNTGSGLAVSSNCFDDINQQNQVTTANGYYKFDLNFSQADCLPASDYLVRITPPATGYNLNPSSIITPLTDATTAALDVPNCPGTATDAIAATAGVCEATTSELAPVLAVPAMTPGTNYYLNLTLNNGVIPDDSQLFNNHLPIDPVLNNAVAITKTSSLVNVTRSKLIPYTITVRNGLPVILTNSNIVDTYPAGFKYVQGSARLNGVAREPTQNGLTLTWSNIDLIPNDTQTIKLLLIVGAAVNEGKYINQAQVIDTLTNSAASEIATATVRVISDPAFDCSDVIGKVYDDKNLNGYQDENENGIAGVKLVTVRGLVSTTDKQGRFHITCAISADENRGSNFVIKLDERSLPSGYRMTTENPRVQRATRGKMIKFNFGSAVHRVVSMDLADDVFVKNSTEIHKQWIPRVDLLIKQLKDKPSILRLSYLADVDDESIVDDRLEKVKQDIIDKWLIENKYKLTIETEVFWRRGGPPDRGDID